jgi:general secretion pathway protein D
VFRCQKTDAPGSGRLPGALLAVAVGCASQQAERESKDAVKQENWDAAVYYYLELVAKHPDEVEYRIGLRRARQNAGNVHFQRGMALREIGRVVEAYNEMEMAVQLDPSHQFAKQVLEDLRKEVEILSGPGGKAELEEMKAKAREAKVKPPVLDPSSKEPVTLVFPKPKPVKEIYDAIGKAYGFNVIFDPKLKDDRIPIELRDVTSERALEIVMQAAGHFYKVLDPKTIVVAEDNPQNRRDYEDLVIKTFFLSNADVKEVDKLLRSLIEARRLSTNEQLNAITLRDTADKVAIAEKLITVNDKAKAEVLVDVELLESTRVTSPRSG